VTLGLENNVCRRDRSQHALLLGTPKRLVGATAHEPKLRSDIKPVQVQFPRSCGTVQVAVTLEEFPARSIAVAVSV